MRARSRLSILAILLTLASASTAKAQPRPGTLQNAGFEQGTPDSIPVGWMVPTPATRCALSADSPAEGKMCVSLARDGSAQPGTFGNLMQTIDATPYRGKRVRFSASVKHTGAFGRAQLWLRVDRPDRALGLFDNMDDRPVLSEKWGHYEIIGMVADDAVTLNVGMMLVGGGMAWVDDADLAALPPGPNADAPARSLSPRGLQNLIAFAKLYGYVRHFHPSDPALAANWDQLAMAGVEQIEGAADDAALATALNAFFGPITPSVKVWVEREIPRRKRAYVTIGTTTLEVPPEATQWVSWRHVGFGQQRDTATIYRNVYSSRTIREPIADVPARNGTKPGTVIEADLGGKVRALVPIGVYADSVGTLPRSSGALPTLNRPADWSPSGDDRTTRLADVIIAWNVLQHFFPYFDVVQTDWPTVLIDSLKRAAKDRDADAFLDTLDRFGAALDDGHTRVSGPGRAVYQTPLDWEWVGDLLVIAETPGDSISPAVKRGDVVISINGRKTKDVYAGVAAGISAATEQWKRVRALDLMGASVHKDQMLLELQHTDGTFDAAKVTLTGREEARAKESRPQDGTEVTPGVLYFNLCGMTTETMTPFLDRMAAAKGLVFDMRGYPGTAGAALLPHLTDKQIQSAHWNIPVILMPDREGVTYQTSNWNQAPLQPHLGGKIVFITDGRAISYAESCLGIVEAYHLGEIVGGPTAGTNGNVNQIPLPGGYKVTFTGMQVTKQDGSRHHGVGILPTVPVSRTVAGISAGSDELLDRAVEIAAAAPGSPTGK